MTDEPSSKGLPALIRSYLDDDAIGLVPDDRQKECRQNTWGYGFDPEVLDSAEVAAALAEVAAGLRLKLTASNAPGPATFYAWYDVQAGQLMCSLSSAQPDRLPFSAAYRSTMSADEVTALMADDPHPGVIPWSELREIADDEEAEELPRAPFPVWVAEVR